MVKKQKTNNKIPNSLLHSLAIVILSIMNLYLLYNIFVNLLPAQTSSNETNRIDSLRTNIQVEVLNGCGISGAADKLTDFLRLNSFDVVNFGNYRSFEIEKSIIIDRTGSSNKVKLIARALGVDENCIIQQINREYLLDVTIILGKDYSKLIPLKKRS